MIVNNPLTPQFGMAFTKSKIKKKNTNGQTGVFMYDSSKDGFVTANYDTRQKVVLTNKDRIVYKQLSKWLDTSDVKALILHKQGKSVFKRLKKYVSKPKNKESYKSELRKHQIDKDGFRKELKAIENEFLQK